MAPTWAQEDVDYAVDLFHHYMAEDKAVLTDHDARPELESLRPWPAGASRISKAPVLDLTRFYSRRMNGSAG